MMVTALLLRCSATDAYADVFLPRLMIRFRHADSRRHISPCCFLDYFLLRCLLRAAVDITTPPLFRLLHTLMLFHERRCRYAMLMVTPLPLLLFICDASITPMVTPIIFRYAADCLPPLRAAEAPYARYELLRQFS